MYAVNWFSAMNLCSVFEQIIRGKKGGWKHEMISRYIYFDKGKGCWDVIGTTWLVMRGTRHDKGELPASILMGFYRGKKKRAPSFI